MFNRNWSDWVDIGYFRQYEVIWGKLYYLQYRTNLNNGAKKFRKVVIDHAFPPFMSIPKPLNPENKENI